MMERLVVDIVGWAGSIEIILAYGLNSYQKIGSKSLVYQLLNLTGGLFLAVNTLYYGAIPSTFINVMWIVIALAAIFNIRRRK